MFILASSAPTSRPNAPRARASCHSESPSPAAARLRQTAGWTTRSTARAPVRFTSCSEAIEPAPARIGTAARKTGSSPSLSPYRCWISGMQVTSRAKVAPWSRKLTASAARPTRRPGAVGDGTGGTDGAALIRTSTRASATGLLATSLPTGRTMLARA